MPIRPVKRTPKGVIIDDGRRQQMAFEYTTKDKSWSISNKAFGYVCLTVFLLSNLIVAAITGHNVALIDPSVADVIRWFSPR